VIGAGLKERRCKAALIGDKRTKAKEWVIWDNIMDKGRDSWMTIAWHPPISPSPRRLLLKILNGKNRVYCLRAARLVSRLPDPSPW
jgi:hypothetical protein